MLYVFAGRALEIDGERVASGNAAVVRADRPTAIRADGEVEILLLQGRPIQEPIARYGPFVMNTDAEIRQAFEDYRRSGFGGWPWPQDGPVHGAERRRFAKHPDGRTEVSPTEVS